MKSFDDLLMEFLRDTSAPESLLELLEEGKGQDKPELHTVQAPPKEGQQK